VVVAAAGLLAPLRATPPASAAAAAAAATGTPDDAHECGETILELVLFGSSLDDVRLEAAAAPVLVYRVPDGLELRVTDVDATAGGLVLWRRSQQQLSSRWAFIVDREFGRLGQKLAELRHGHPVRRGRRAARQAAGG
jgi:hypothetical protein